MMERVGESGDGEPLTYLYGWWPSQINLSSQSLYLSSIRKYLQKMANHSKPNQIVDNLKKFRSTDFTQPLSPNSITDALTQVMHY